MIEPVSGGLRWTALCTGVLALALITASGQVPPPPQTSGVTVRVLSSTSGPLEASRSGLMAATLSLQADDAPLDSRITLSNRTGKTLPVAVLASATDPQLQDRLWLEILTGARSLYRGPLEGLAGALRVAAPVRSGQERSFTLRLSIRPERSPLEYAGSATDVRIEWRPASPADPHAGAD